MEMYGSWRREWLTDVTMIRLYSFQTDVVYQVLNGTAYVIQKKSMYEKNIRSLVKVFINAYGWFVKEAQHIVPNQKEPSIHTRAFTDLYNVDLRPRWT